MILVCKADNLKDELFGEKVFLVSILTLLELGSVLDFVKFFNEWLLDRLDVLLIFFVKLFSILTISSSSWLTLFTILSVLIIVTATQEHVET